MTTAKQIIIDEIDVSGCEAIGTDGWCSLWEENCAKNPDCIHKKYLRKEQKLEKIKEILEIHKEDKCTICPKFDECFEQPSCDNVILQIIEGKENG